MELEFHPVANIFPLIEGDAFDELVASIKNGYDDRHPIAIFEGKILDGRNRYRAAKEAGVEPTTFEWTGTTEDAIAWTWQENYERRQLDSSQRACCISSRNALMASLRAEAEKRKQSGKSADGKAGGRGKRKDINLTEQIPQGLSRSPTSAAKAAAIGGTNEKYVREADKLRVTEPALFAAATQGKITIPDAKSLAKVEESERPNLIAAVESGKAKNIKAAIKSASKAVAVAESKNARLPEGKYQVIVADPPWQYDIRLRRRR